MVTNPTNSNTVQEYNNPIQVKDRSDQPNIYSDYAENDNSPISVSRVQVIKSLLFL